MATFKIIPGFARLHRQLTPFFLSGCQRAGEITSFPPRFRYRICHSPGLIAVPLCQRVALIELK
ncbi:hypothetical protein GCM10007071_25060 [Marinobacter zhanjiangensis]|uniref:Uncharacterized protein n=1 Tax=Marinobacter zhanjiangensis TaxID=578215 RepID=A0ABQ3B302_9GAMM|nr:hypothetical protein GCM10007071_25060 [Marinobacter zhanjiangensis]